MPPVDWYIGYYSNVDYDGACHQSDIDGTRWGRHGHIVVKAAGAAVRDVYADFAEVVTVWRSLPAYIRQRREMPAGLAIAELRNGRLSPTMIIFATDCATMMMTLHIDCSQ